MIEKDDFIKPDGQEDGLNVYRELSCGCIPYVPGLDLILLMSKTGALGSFCFPKGHVKVIDGFPEDPLSCAIRETREEICLPEKTVLIPNGIMLSTYEKKDYPKNKQRSYKTITYLGVYVRGNWNEGALPNGRWLHAATPEEARKYCSQEITPTLDACLEQLRWLRQ